MLGIFLGIFLLSNNWLIRTISRVYVEILRNTPLLVQLIFWYFVVWLGLPEDDINLPREHVFVFWQRYVVYLIAFLVVWWAARRYRLPARIVTGAFLGIVLLEIAFALLGTSSAVIIGLAVVGAALIAAVYSKAVPLPLRGPALGVGVLGVVQLVGHALQDLLFQAGVLPHPQLLYNEVRPAVIMARNGFVMPDFIISANFGTFGLFLLVGIVIAVVLYIVFGRITDRTGRPIPREWIALLIVLVFGVGGWWFASSQPLPETVTVGEGDNAETLPLEQVREEELLDDRDLLYYSTDPLVVQLPERNRFGRVQAGAEISPSYMALLIGLVVYTSAFIGEIVRAGIQAVPYGQIEAARAVGLTMPQTLRMIILPQALRVIIPPLGNQYLNLSKNSSLATFVAYADTYQVGQTIMNQSGQSITGFFLVLLVYLIMSLLISLVMNLVNSRFQLVTR